MRVRFLVFPILFSFLVVTPGGVVRAQDGVPPPELKTDVPTDTLSVGNGEEEPANAAPSTAPAREKVPPPNDSMESEESAGEAAAPAESSSGQEQTPQEQPSPQDQGISQEEEAAPEENLKTPPPSGEAKTAPEEEGASLDLEDESGSSEKAEDTSADATNKARQKICDCHFSSETSYRDRRTSLGALFGIEVGSFDPSNYQPDFSTNDFDDYFAKKGPNIELMGAAKWNFFLGSIGPIISAGFYQASSNDGDALQLIPVTAGITYALDNLFSEPYVVPYVTGGMYTILYQETQAGLSVKGNSAFAPFFSLGVRLQMDALDPESHETGYEDFGVENTFLFVEARQFLQSSNPEPDFSTPLQVSGGFMVEF